MLYLPERNLLFVHIPRTAGNAITRAITKAVADDQAVVSITLQHGPLHRHSIASDVLEAYGLWGFQPDVWFVRREYNQILNSDFRLWSSIPLNYEFRSEQNRLKREAASQGRGAFRAYWQNVLRSAGAESIEEMYLAGALNRRPILYSHLEDGWRHLCEAAGCPGLELPRRDYELEYVRSFVESS